MAATVLIGNYRERVTVQSATVTRGADFNEEILTWPTNGSGTTVWAQVTARPGREPVLADRPVMLVGYEVKIRYGVTVTNKQRLLWRDKVLSIETVTPNPAQGEILITCMEATA